MKPDALPLTDIEAVTAKGDVIVVLWADFERFIAPRPNLVVTTKNSFIQTEFPHLLIGSPRPFGSLVPGTMLRFKSLTGDTDWSGIAEYCSIFDGAREITKYATRLAAGAKDEEHA